MLRLATPLSVFAVAGASFALAACGSSSDSDNSSASSRTGTTANGSGTRNADFQRFQQCLKDNGVTLPGRGQGGPGGSNAAPPNTNGGGFGPQNADPKTQKAMRACAKYRPQGNFRGRNGDGNGAPQQNVRAFTAYLTCLRDAGLDVKVADGFNALRNLKQSDPKVQAALRSCQSKLPQRPQGSSAAPSSADGTT
jgi:hypothetical protein